MSLVNLFTGLAANASAVNRVVDIDTDGKDVAMLELTGSKLGTTSQVEIVPSVSIDGGTTYVRMTTRTFTEAEVSTNAIFSDIFAFTANFGIGIQYDVSAVTNLRLLFNFTNAAAADKFSARMGLE